MTNDLRAVADECCGGKLIAVTEGGYDLKALTDSLRAVVGVMAHETRGEVAWPAATAASVRGKDGVKQAQSALASHWKF